MSQLLSIATLLIAGYRRKKSIETLQYVVFEIHLFGNVAYETLFSFCCRPRGRVLSPGVGARMAGAITQGAV